MDGLTPGVTGNGAPITVYYRKQGRVATVFMGDGNMPMPIHNFDEEPPGFPWVTNEHELRAMFPNAKFIAVEQQRPPQPEANPVSDEQLAAFMKTTPQAKQIVAANPAPVPSVQVNEKIKTELALLFARYGEASGARKKQLKIELEAVARFILAVEPSYKEMLEQLKESLEYPKFSL